MKKFMIGAAVLIFCLLALYYAVYYNGFYLNLHPDAPVQVAAKTEGKQIVMQNEEGEFEPFLIRGVDLPSSIAGNFANDFAVDEETWLRWFGQIQEMGANSIRIYTIYNDVFYNAFYRFNTENERPLYLLQGLQVSDYANRSDQDAYGTEFYAQLKKDSIDAVDVLHGRKIIPLNRMKGSGTYRKDVSSWVLGYVIGNEWNAGTIAYTNNNRNRDSSYQGTYFATTQNASIFEAMLAKIMDEMVDYETEKYKTQKLISFQNNPEIDPFVYEEQYARQLGKFTQINAEHLIATKELQSGYFASYRLYEFCPDFANYLSEQQIMSLHQRFIGVNLGPYYQSYTQLLSQFHTIPVVITGYGFSSSRGTDSTDGPLTEQEQGERLIEVYKDLVQAGCSGAYISTWQDEWNRRTWNTAYAVDVSNTNLWHDIQSNATGYGLLSFDPGKLESACIVDGSCNEWTPQDQLLDAGGAALSIRYDARCLYLKIEKQGLSDQEPLFIPIDVTPKTGSRISPEPLLYFDSEADFLLCLQGKSSSRLLVQARYEALRENYLLQTEGEDPFVTFPEKVASHFVPIRMILQKHKLVSLDEPDEVLEKAKLFDTYETGRLVYGNGNPADSSYSSLADFCYGQGSVEVRIPWQMLNFSNPSKMEIHDDYYERYGVEWFQIEGISLGIGFPGQDHPVTMVPLSLKGWGEDVAFHERLKKSYEVVREGWGGYNAF